MSVSAYYSNDDNDDIFEVKRYKMRNKKEGKRKNNNPNDKNKTLLERSDDA